MAYINQYEADMDRQRKADQGLGMALQGLQGMEENRRRALDEKRKQFSSDIQYAALGVAPTEQENKEMQESGYSKTLLDRLATPLKEKADRTKKITEAKSAKAIYEADQLNKPLEERDGYKQTIAASNAKSEAAEKLRIDAESRAAKKKEESDKYVAVDNLRKEIAGLPATKGLVEIDTALSKIRTAPISAAGDITRVFSFMKLNDPNSTVREGEYATAQNAAGIPERLRAQYNAALNGQRLTEEQRADFENSALSLAKSQYDTYLAVTQPHRSRVKQLGVDEGQIFPSFSQQNLMAPQQQVPQQPEQAPQQFSAEDNAAIQWAKANANDPRAKQILQIHGVN